MPIRFLLMLAVGVWTIFPALGLIAGGAHFIGGEALGLALYLQFRIARWVVTAGR